jgi:hypothetical protein
MITTKGLMTRKRKRDEKSMEEGDEEEEEEEEEGEEEGKGQKRAKFSYSLGSGGNQDDYKVSHSVE